ncbi:MAG: bifunctional helix-turn-helix transcriptional regulator/GNAT family N-acetyltransferase [Saprospiraceae bacterium]|nr:bifunctional helix-turn-helix transcriptional regulator/GNAT family N-acetyltransferase [Saprospiraceae bacterium]
MDIIKHLGGVALGSRLKRLSERLAKDAAALYKKNGLDFEPRWFPTFYALHQSQHPLSITALSETTGFTHPAIVVFVKELEKAEWVTTEKDTTDGRKRLVMLSEKAKKRLPDFQNVWQVVSEEISKRIQEQEHNILFAIEEFERSLGEGNYLSDLEKNLKYKQAEEITIVDFRTELQPEFVAINLEWIEKYFKIEPHDTEQLEQADKYILSGGGSIFFAEFKNEVVGTVALVKTSDEEFELAKMGVRPKAQGRQVGKKLVARAIEKAKEQGAKRIFLETNSILSPAIELYQKMGFRKIRPRPSLYQRADVQMILDL